MLVIVQGLKTCLCFNMFVDESVALPPSPSLSLYISVVCACVRGRWAKRLQRKQICFRAWRAFVFSTLFVRNSLGTDPPCVSRRSEWDSHWERATWRSRMLWSPFLVRIQPNRSTMHFAPFLVGFRLGTGHRALRLLCKRCVLVCCLRIHSVT